jgi:hypothetical protein
MDLAPKQEEKKGGKTSETGAGNYLEIPGLCGGVAACGEPGLEARLALAVAGGEEGRRLVAEEGASGGEGARRSGRCPAAVRAVWSLV